jgi:DNA gyrase subunit A
LINLKGNDSIAAVAKVMREDEEDIEAIEGLDEEGVEEGTTDTKPADTEGTTIDTQEKE